MPKVKYEDGTVIEFDSTPSPQDIEEAYNQAKGITSSSPTPSSPTPSPSMPTMPNGMGISSMNIPMGKGKVTIKPTGITPQQKQQMDMEKQLAPEIREYKTLSSQAMNLKDLYIRAREELSTTKGIGKPGVEGRVAGLIGKGKSALGVSPLANTYNARRLGFATTIAKAAGEVRPTDDDIKRFLKSLPDLALSDKENENRIIEMEKDLASKNPEQIWKERSTGRKTIKLPSGKTIEIGG